MKITRDQIEKIFSILIKKLNYLQFDEIEINKDFYWVVSDEDLTNFAEDKSPIIGVGSATDDWNELSKLLENNDQMVTLIDLDRFAAILKIISVEFSTFN